MNADAIMNRIQGHILINICHMLKNCIFIFFILSINACQAEDTRPNNTLAGNGLALIPIDNFRDFLSFSNDPLNEGNLQTPASGYTQILSADAVAAYGNDIFVADPSQRTVFRIDRGRRTLSRFASLENGAETDLYVSSDLSLYEIDGFQRQVTQYGFDARQVRVYQNNLELSTPVAIAESRQFGGILVADRVANQIVAFNRLGGLSRILGQNINVGPVAGSIKDMTADENFIYILDELGRQVNTVDMEGRVLYSFGKEQLKQPVALAVDRCHRVFVADQFDNAIHVYLDDTHLASFNSNSGYTGLVRLNDIDIDIDVLYMADGATGDIRMMRIDGKCL